MPHDTEAGTRRADVADGAHERLVWMDVGLWRHARARRTQLPWT
jgi:hypothetical protein